MTLAGLLNQTYVLLPRTAVTGTAGADRYNNPLYTYPEGATVHGRIHQSTSFERIAGRDTTITNYTLYLMPDPECLALTELDRVKDAANVVYELDGRPMHATSPRGQHHIEASIRRVEG